MVVHPTFKPISFKFWANYMSIEFILLKGSLKGIKQPILW